MDAGFDKNEAVLGVFILAVTLQMLTDGDGLLDQEVQVLRNGGAKTYQKMNQYLQSKKLIVFIPLARRIRMILLPVKFLTCPIPWESRRRIPIWDGVKPFLANLTTSSLTSSVEVFNQLGARRL